MTFGTAVEYCFRNGLDFEGRASRSEFWWFALFVSAGEGVAAFVDAATVDSPPLEMGIFESMLMLPYPLPALSVGIRRPHDTGLTGWWIVPCRIPVALGHDLLLALDIPGNIPAPRMAPPPLLAFLTREHPGIIPATLVVGVLPLAKLPIRKATAGPNRFGPGPLGCGK